MDGVLFLSTQSHELAFKAICEKYSLTNFFYSEISGMRTDEAFVYILNKNKVKYSSELLEKMTIEKRKIASHLLREKPIFAENCYNILKDLSEKYTLSLASSSHQKNVDLFLDTSDTKRFFKIIITGNNVTKSKPDPEIFTKILQMTSIKAHESLVIEDSVKGIQAANNANINSIGIANNDIMKETLTNSGALYTYSTVNEFYQTLREGNIINAQ